jgi:inorganic pyrophosphatase
VFGSDYIRPDEYPLTEKSAFLCCRANSGNILWKGLAMAYPGIRKPLDRLELSLSDLRKSYRIMAVIETTAGRRSKFKYDPELGLFKLHSTLPFGFAYPFDFGFIPSTLGADGDPLDLLVLSDEPSFCGCLLECRLIGGFTAIQKSKGKRFRNDRLIGISLESHQYKDVRKITQLSKTVLQQVEFFFSAFNKMVGKDFKPLQQVSASAARKLIEKGFEEFKKKQRTRE